MSYAMQQALKLTTLSFMQQARALRAMERKARNRHAEALRNDHCESASTYHWHRTVRVARQARAYHLFRCFLKGVPYKCVENTTRNTSLNPIDVMFNELSPNLLSMALADSLIDWVEQDMN